MERIACIVDDHPRKSRRVNAAACPKAQIASCPMGQRHRGRTPICSIAWICPPAAERKASMSSVPRLGLQSDPPEADPSFEAGLDQGAPRRETSLLATIVRLWPYLWPSDRFDLKL